MSHLEKERALHQRDLAQDSGSVALPFALARKYPNADREWGWQYVFPSRNLSTARGDTVLRRHHLDEKNLQRQVVITQRALDRLEAEAGGLGPGLDLGNLCIAIALDYLDFRFAGDAWRKGRPNLDRWHERFGARPSLQLTMPSEARLG